MSKLRMGVLDKGFVEIVDMMGSDMRVCQAARVSTGGEASKGDKKDRGLIRYLMMNEHMTPFEKIVFEFHVKCPIFIARQWMRHRIGSYNEASGRYKEFEWETYVPNEWRKQDEVNKQGSVGGFDEEESEKLNRLNELSLLAAKQVYETNIFTDVAREQARIVMPLAQYTEFFWTVNFRSLANFITLRSDSHAQQEIQDYANAIYKILQTVPEIKWSLEIFTEVMQLKQALSASVETIGINATINLLS
jgi:thymidylate synthase (FAD)